MLVKYDIASPGDIPCIVDMKIDMFREFDYTRYLVANARDIIIDDYRQMYEEKLAIHFLAKVNDKIVGMVGAFIKSDIPYRYFVKGQYGFIGDVYTITSCRSLGVSTQLNKTALTWLREYGVNSVRLLASDAGRPIYERLGFSPDVDMVLYFENQQ